MFKLMLGTLDEQMKNVAGLIRFMLSDSSSCITLMTVKSLTTCETDYFLLNWCRYINAGVNPLSTPAAILSFRDCSGFPF